jgi:hypothetical protein
MKTPNFKSIGSKTAKTIFAISLLTLAGVSACKKDATSTTTPTVTEADAVQLTTDAVVPSTGGMVTQTTSSVTLSSTAETAAIPCGTTKDTTIAGASVSGAAFTYAYSLNWNYVLNCSTNAFTLNFTGSSSYTGALMSSNDASTGTYVVTGVLPGATSYSLTSSYERKGSQTSKVGQQTSFTSDLKITSSNIIVNKATDEISSGTATVSITGETSGGKSFSFGGTLTFLGGQQGTLVLNSGTSYAISWE